MTVIFRPICFGACDGEDGFSNMKRTPKKNRAKRENLPRAGDALRRQNGELGQQLAILRKQAESCQDSRREIETLTAQVQCLEAENRQLQESLHQTQEHCDELQVQADEYAKIRDHIAEIEINAHRRTEEFRAQAIQRLHETVSRQRSWCGENSTRYKELLSRFIEKLQSARDILQETDLSGFDDMLRSLDELDEELDK